MKTIVATFALAIAAGQAHAANGDFKLGTFGTMFCGAPASFEVTARRNQDWEFDGKIAIRDTGEYDQLFVKQMNDNSLVIVRYLSGRHTGQQQQVRTSPPKFLREANAAAWPAAADNAMTGDGAGCTDRAKAAELATLEDTDPRYIAIWAEGMKDSSCRGFSTGQQVRVVERDGGLACVLAADDVSCHWIGDDIAPD